MTSLQAKRECVSCHRQIDEAARLCPYCGANPVTGERFDPQPLLEKHFARKAPLAAGESVLEFVRQRQAVVVTAVTAAVFLLAVSLHQIITLRNARVVNDVPAIPLTEVTDLSKRAGENVALPMPDLDFQYGGSAQTMRTLLIEPGAVAPPPITTAVPGVPPTPPVFGPIALPSGTPLTDTQPIRKVPRKRTFPVSSAEPATEQTASEETVSNPPAEESSAETSPTPPANPPLF